MCCGLGMIFLFLALIFTPILLFLLKILLKIFVKYFNLWLQK